MDGMLTVVLKDVVARHSEKCLLTLLFREDCSLIIKL